MSVLQFSDNTDPNRSYGLPGNRLAKALNGWQVDRLPGDYYRILNTCPDDLALILRAFGISIPSNSSHAETSAPSKHLPPSSDL